jgi:hypothetical protein
LGTIVPSTADPQEEDATYWIEVKPLDAAFRRIRVGITVARRRPRGGHGEGRERDLGDAFGVLTEAGLMPEFEDPYWLTTCRPLPDGMALSVDVLFDRKPALAEAEPTSVVYLERQRDPYRACSR